MDYVIHRISLDDPLAYKLIERAIEVYGDGVLPLFVVWNKRGNAIWKVFYEDCKGNLGMLLDLVRKEISNAL
jgi:hypothetical protein